MTTYTEGITTWKGVWGVEAPVVVVRVDGAAHRVDVGRLGEARGALPVPA